RISGGERRPCHRPHRRRRPFPRRGDVAALRRAAAARTAQAGERRPRGAVRRRIHPRDANQDEGDDVNEELNARIKSVIDNEPVALFMKGTPQFVMCGNSERALQALRSAGAPVTAIDVLPDPEIRQELSALSGWPTIPQVFIGGELVGGADIVQELAESGELERTLEEKLGAGYRDARDERVVNVLA